MAASVWVREVHQNWEVSRIKSEPQVKGSQLQLTSRKGRLIEKTPGIWDAGTGADPKISGTIPKKSEAISSQFDTLTLPLLSSLILLA